MRTAKETIEATAAAADTMRRLTRFPPALQEALLAVGTAVVDATENERDAQRMCARGLTEVDSGIDAVDRLMECFYGVTQAVTAQSVKNWHSRH